MEVLNVLIPVAISFAGIGCLAFMWAVKRGQFDDLETPAHEVMLDEPKERQ